MMNETSAENAVVPCGPGRPLAGQLRDAIRDDGRSNHAIAVAAKIQPDTVRLFLLSNKDIKLSTAGSIATVVGLRPEPGSDDGGSILDRLRTAIHADDRSTRDIALASQVKPDAMKRFIAGEKDLWLATADRIAKVVGLRFVPAAPTVQAVPDAPLSMTLGDAIRADNRSSYAIALAAGVGPGPVYKFASGSHDLRFANAGQVASILGLRLLPPVEGAAESIVDQFRAAILADGRLTRTIERESKVTPDSLDKFVKGKKDLWLATADRVATTLGLKFGPDPCAGITGDRTAKPAQKAKVPKPARRCPVEIRGEGLPILIREGKRSVEVPKMTGVAYKVLELLTERYDQRGGCTPGELRTLIGAERAMPLFGQALKREGFEPLRRMIPAWNAGRNKVVQIIDAENQD